MRLRKKEKVVKELQDKMNRNNICIIRIPEGEEEEQGIENLFEKSNNGKLPEFDERKSHTNPGNTQNPNQDKHKEAHFNTHHN